MIKEIEIIERLLKEAEVNIITLANYFDCVPASIRNYLLGGKPNKTKIQNIRKGLIEYKKLINEIIPDEL